MFDNDQLHQFIASSRTSSLPIIPLSFPLNGNPLFDPYSSASSSSLHTQIITKSNIIDENKLQNPLISTSLVLETERSMDPWSNDEVLALLKLRSTMEIWFPDVTWEHISRKLGELGYKKSAQQCKEKFEEESRSFNTNKNNIFSELDELYPSERVEKVYKNHIVEENPSPKTDEEVVKMPQKSIKKRKRSSSKDIKFEKFKGFCEAFVKKMMAQQEEMHNKMIEDIVKRDEAKIAREEAWKNQEMDRLKKEIEIRANEQENAAIRQGKIIEFLKKFTSEDKDQNLAKKIITSNSCDSVRNNTTTPITSHQNPNSFPCLDSVITSSPSCPSSNLGIQDSEKARTSKLSKAQLDLTPNYEGGSGDHTGKRWPRDEVLALINLRCKMNINGDENNKDVIKGPLWERISQGMLELGYNRSAKRCKEKWENINKYFRKTKDSDKKRSVDSRTCPYFHQLSSLYSEGTQNQ